MKTIGEIKKYKMCATPNVVSCPNKKKGECSKCIDITDATNWLLKELKPKSGTLLTGVMNNDYAAFLLTKYASQFKAPIQQQIAIPTNECIENWFAQGNDENSDWWQLAPYRTNGDMVEEIKTAINYFLKTWQRLDLKEEVPNTEQGKETAIGFAEWIEKENYIFSEHHEIWYDCIKYPNPVNAIQHTTSELFTLYLNRNN